MTATGACCRRPRSRAAHNRGRAAAGEDHGRASRPGWQAVRVIPRDGTVRVPAGVCLDLGASAKAWAADRAAAAAAAESGCGVLVGIGGDIATSPARPRRTGWRSTSPTTTAATPRPRARRHDPLGRAGHLEHRGAPLAARRGTRCTTSSIPPPARPWRDSWRTVSVAAASCADANIAATAALVRSREAPPWLARAGLPARLVAWDGSVTSVAGWPAPMTGVLASSGPSVHWYLTRSTGVVSLLLLTAALVLGVADVRRFSTPSWPRFVVDSLHRSVSLLALAFLAVHIVTSVLDSFTSISLLDAIVPFAGSYRPFWLGLGAVAFDLMLAVIITSLLRARIGFTGWRAVHWLAYASWPVALVHGLGTGSDVKSGWMLVLSVAVHARRDRSGARARVQRLALGDRPPARRAGGDGRVRGVPAGLAAARPARLGMGPALGHPELAARPLELLDDADSRR